MVATTIRAWLDAWDSYCDKSKVDATKKLETSFGHIYLGTPQSKETLFEVEKKSQSKGFTNFRIKLSDYLSQLIQVSQQALPNNKWLKLKPNETVGIIYILLFFFLIVYVL